LIAAVATAALLLLLLWDAVNWTNADADNVTAFQFVDRTI
jgi:hypothetical protein